MGHRWRFVQGTDRGRSGRRWCTVRCDVTGITVTRIHPDTKSPVRQPACVGAYERSRS